MVDMKDHMSISNWSKAPRGQKRYPECCTNAALKQYTLKFPTTERHGRSFPNDVSCSEVQPTNHWYSPYHLAQESNNQQTYVTSVQRTAHLYSWRQTASQTGYQYQGERKEKWLHIGGLFQIELWIYTTPGVFNKLSSGCVSRKCSAVRERSIKRWRNAIQTRPSKKCVKNEHSLLCHQGYWGFMSAN